MPIGPGFDYRSSPEIFLGRTASGPLRIAIDTNILIDYLDYGPMMWEGQPAPAMEPNHAAEVDALEVLVNLWLVRDIRFLLPREVVQDAKRVLRHDRAVRRAHAVEQFAAALGYGDSEPKGEEPTEPIPMTLRQHALAAVPRGNDRGLVARALDSGAHVFLTRDAGVLHAAPAVEMAGLHIASPLDLLEELAACGALMCLIDRSYAYWPIPDLGRMPHLIAALDKGQ